MCTRFSCKLTLETVEALFSAVSDLSRPPPPPRADFALGQEIAVLPAGGGRTLTSRRWGWPKPDSGLLANARSETLLQKPLFARHADARRCVVPADGFFEFRSSAGMRQPWFFSLKSTPVFGLAGLMNANGEVVLLTTEPNARVRSIHRRMPVILRADLLSGWLNPALPFLSLPQDFLTPWPSDDMAVQPPEPDRLTQQPELF